MENDKNLDMMNEFYRNANLALLSISDVLPAVKNQALRKEILKQYEGYEKIAGEMSKFMKEKGYEAKEVGAFKKFSMASGIKMNTLMDDSKSNIAQIMIKGTVMGITEICKLLNGKIKDADPEVVEYGEKLRELEEGYEQSLKKYL